MVELKSVNNRFRDINLRSPREYLALEPRVQAILKAAFARGRIDAYVRRAAGVSGHSIVADTALALEYAQAMRAVAEVMPDYVNSTFSIEQILAQAGVLTTAETQVDVTLEWDIVEIALQAAVTDLLQMREAEGATIQRDLREMVDQVRTAVAEVEAAAKGINERTQKKLLRRIQRLTSDKVDPYRLAQEVAYLSDKADINEEITRLFSHCDQFRSALDQDEPVGRRMDFLLQEMNREVNTIGSKASEHPIARRVVVMKSILERMREQSANVE